MVSTDEAAFVLSMAIVWLPLAAYALHLHRLRRRLRDAAGASPPVGE